MPNPVEILLNQVDWQPVTPPDEIDGEPYAMHSGILNLGTMEMRVFQLNNGQRIILKEDFERFFGCGLGLPE
jgi:hypothetical protein